LKSKTKTFDNGSREELFPSVLNCDILVATAGVNRQRLSWVNSLTTAGSMGFLSNNEKVIPADWQWNDMKEAGL